MLIAVVLFVVCAAVIWSAGVRLSNATAVLDTRLHLGSALGGVVVLAVATNLPEIAITVSAALSGDLSVAIGNILGGIALQTLVLVALDAAGGRGRHPLTYRAASLGLVLDAALVVAVLTVSVMGTQLPSTLHLGPVAPASVLIVVLWLAGIVVVGRTQGKLPWHEAGNAPSGQSAPRGDSKVQREKTATARHRSTTRTAIVFTAAAVATLVAGVVLERSGEAIADHIGLTGVLFGSTVLAAATSLPELSTGITSVRLGDDQLAMGDIFGGNAFLPVLFLVATLIAGEPALPQSQHTDIYLTGLGILMTAVYIIGLLTRPRRTILGVGPDSLLVVLLYGTGIAGLIAVSS